MCDPDNAYIVIDAVAVIKELLSEVIGAIEHPQEGKAYTREHASGTLWSLKRLLKKELTRSLVRIEAASAWLESPSEEHPLPPAMRSLSPPAESSGKAAQSAPEGAASAAYRAIEALWRPVAIAAVAIEMWEAEGVYIHDEDEEDGGEALQTMRSLERYLARTHNECVALIDDALERLGPA